MKAQRYLVFIALLVFSFVSCTEIIKKPKPNILFIMSDDHAFQAISAYNDKLIETPNIDRIASGGILYNKAFVTNSICAPSRAVILTGKYSHLNGVKGNSEVFDGMQPTLPKILQENGYQTAIVGKWHLKSHPSGFDYWNVLPGQGDYYNPDFIKLGKDTTYKGYVTEIISDLSINWLKKRKKDKPFFLMMHHKAPHRSWMPAIKNLQLFDDKDFPLPDNFYDDYEGRKGLQQQMLTVKDHMDIRMDFKVPCNECDTVEANWWAPEEYWRRLNRLTPEERKSWEESYKKEETEFWNVKDDPKKYDQWKFRRYMEDYLRCIASVDESVGEMLAYLKESGLDKNTLIVYTSDQGFYLGEHGLFDKRFMYEEALRTPLLMKYPGEISPGAVSEKLVQNLDIAPTLLEATGLTVPADMQGTPLQKTWSNQEEWRDAIYYHFYEKGWGVSPHYGIRTERYKLIHFYDGLDEWELYDLKNDPMEMDNLIDKIEHTDNVNDLKKRLWELQKKYKDQYLVNEILADKNFQQVDSMARQLMKKGFYAGSGYQMVWSRDLNTFIELSCEEYDQKVIRENLLMFFHFQQENGELLDGYVPREAFTWGDPNTYESKTAPGHIGFKNTVETDQETSLIQAISKYIQKTGDDSILNEKIAGKTVHERLKLALEYLLSERYSEKYGLITGATTFDWGDVQVEGGAVVDVDSLTHWSIDVYDNAMYAIALKNMTEFESDEKKIKYWENMRSDVIENIRKYLWDTKNQKFIPHVYINNSPFPEDFIENEIHYHGGTAVAIEAGVLNSDEIDNVLLHMKKNVKLSGAPSIGLTVYPPYPKNVLGKNISGPYEYQNGGDWTWFGGRMIQQLVANGKVNDAYELAKPMMERVVKNSGFYEWYKIDGTPAGSAEFKGSAGVLAKSIELFYEWAKENN